MRIFIQNSFLAAFGSFSLILFGFVTFGAKILYKKLILKILMELTAVWVYNFLRKEISAKADANQTRNIGNIG
jgi:hypothetical protein